MSEWQDIESAPKDGTPILVCGGSISFDAETYPEDRPFDGVAIVTGDGRSDGDWQGGAGSEYDSCYWHKPKFWMPLPTPPKGDS